MRNLLPIRVVYLQYFGIAAAWSNYPAGGPAGALCAGSMELQFMSDRVNFMESQEEDNIRSQFDVINRAVRGVLHANFWCVLRQGR